MDLHLNGRRAFISGSTQGIGYAIAHALAAEGVDVVLNGRHPDACARAAARLRGELPGAHVDTIAADFGDAAQVDALLDRLEPVDILVNNVGIFDLVDVFETADADWQRYLEIDLLSAVRLSRAVMPAMLENGWGRIISIASESGVDVPADMIPYGVAKAGMIALGNGLAKLTRGTRVTVNTILGGPVFSDGVAAVVDEIARTQGASAEAVKSGIEAAGTTSLVQRFLRPDEIAHLAVYLASPLASATNGAALRADGGVLTAML